MPKKQTEKLLDALARKPMTSLDILNELGIARGAARVFDLRRDGFDVQSRDIVVKNRDGEECRVALYSLASQQRTLLAPAPGRGATSA